MLAATSWLSSWTATLAIAAASIGILHARARPTLHAFACWAAIGLCATLGLIPAGAAAALALAVAAAVASDRLPAGLAWALFAWLTSIAAGWTFLSITPLAARQIPAILAHAAAVLAAWWMFAAGLTRRWPDRWAADARAAFLMTAVTAAVAALILLVYSATIVTYWRLTQALGGYPIYIPSTAWRGLVDIGLLIVAAQLSRLIGRWPALPVATLWLVIFAGTWWGLMLPRPHEPASEYWPDWLTWSVWIQVAWAWPLLGAMLAWIWQGWRRQERAWPSDLGWLVRTAKPWPGLEPSATAIGLVLIPLGLWHAFATGTEGHHVARMTTWSMAGAALGLSIFIGWRWSRTLAELALSLWTVSLAALAATTSLQLAGPASSIERLPAVHTGVLTGLAGASLLWFWLASVWRQQLHRERHWTTAGRLIPLADRVGFLAAALGVLVGAKMAMWPRMQYGAADNSPLRLAIGSMIYLLLIGICLYAARQVRKPTMFWLAGLAGMAWGTFLWLRR